MKKHSLSIILLTSAFAGLLWLFGLGWTLQDQFMADRNPEALLQKKDEVPQKRKDSTLNILALGDSLTRGTGDAEGKGYVGYMTELLKKKSDQQITLVNTAIKGETSQGILKLLKQKEILRQIGQADVIVMTIGGNDLFQQGAALQTLDRKAINLQKQMYIKNMQIIYGKLREQNKAAVIYHIGLYNPFSGLQDTETTSAIVRDWNVQTAEAAAEFEKIVFVPTFDLFQLQVEKFLYSDQFHPNTEGYQLIAERVASLITLEQEEDAS